VDENAAIVAVIRELFKAKDFERYVCVTDEPETILRFLAQQRGDETPAQRMVRRRRDLAAVQ